MGNRIDERRACESARTPRRTSGVKSLRTTAETVSPGRDADSCVSTAFTNSARRALFGTTTSRLISAMAWLLLSPSASRPDARPQTPNAASSGARRMWSIAFSIIRSNRLVGRRDRPWTSNRPGPDRGSTCAAAAPLDVQHRLREQHGNQDDDRAAQQQNQQVAELPAGVALVPADPQESQHRERHPPKSRLGQQVRHDRPDHGRRPEQECPRQKAHISLLRLTQVRDERPVQRLGGLQQAVIDAALAQRLLHVVEEFAHPLLVARRGSTAETCGSCRPTPGPRTG